MATLSIAELKKRRNWSLFISKIEEGLPFVHNSTKKDLFIGFKESKRNKALASELKKKKPDYLKEIFKQGNSVILPTPDGKGVNINKLFKTTEFGSSGRTGTEKEDIALDEFNEALEQVKKKTKKSPVKLYVGNGFVEVDKIVSTPGAPKSDFHAVDLNGREVAWFSHKDGRYAKDFQQWGGMTEPQIKNLPIIQKFASDVFAKYGGVMPRATTVARKITNNSAGTKLHGMSVYGVDYGKKTGQQNVDVLIQGPVSLKKRGSGWEVVSNHVHYNGEMMKGDFEPVLMAMYKGDRSNFDVKGARFAIQPIGSRKIKEWV